MSSNPIANPPIFRENVRSKLIQKFGKDMNSSILANIEIGVYNYAIKEASNLKIIKKWDIPAFSTIYMDRLRTIYNNLKTSPELLALLHTEELSPKTLAFMTHPEMNYYVLLLPFEQYKNLSLLFHQYSSEYNL